MSRAFWIREDPARNWAKVKAVKASRPKRCEACAWTPPSALDVEGLSPAGDMLHAHHVYPVAMGGVDAASNLVVLCPTCHAVAHRLSLVRADTTGERHYIGPCFRDELLVRLAELRDAPESAAARLRADVARMADRLAHAKLSRRRRARREMKQAEQASVAAPSQPGTQQNAKSSNFPYGSASQ